MPHFLLETIYVQLDIFTQHHNLYLPFGTTNFVHRFTFELIKNGARETTRLVMGGNRSHMGRKR